MWRVSSTAAFFAAFFRRIFSSCSSLSLRAFSLPVPLQPMPKPATWTLDCEPVPFLPPFAAAAACVADGSSFSSSSEETSPRRPFLFLERLRSTACAACVAASSACASACSLRICFVMRFTCSSVFGLLLPFAMVFDPARRRDRRRRLEWLKICGCRELQPDALASSGPRGLIGRGRRMGLTVSRPKKQARKSYAPQ